VLAKHLLPKFLKDILQHIPTLALKSVNWTEVLKELGPMLMRLGQPDLDPKHLQILGKLEIPNLHLVNNINVEPPIAQLPKEELVRRGEVVLKLYFSQLKNPAGLNLDLRAKHFELKEDVLNWSPNNTWYQLSEDFRLALIQIYKGFYYKRENDFTEGLELIGLSKHLNDKQKSELKSLFYKHFGPGEQESVKFDLIQFQNSFYELFHFFIENKVQLHKDFIFVGVYLVTLYMHLQELDVELNVRKVFLEIFNC
jgi:hypothetical protein